MKRRVLLSSPLIASMLFVAVSTAAAEGIPVEVGKRVDDAGMLGESEEFVGSFTYTDHTLITKTNGKGRHEATTVTEVTRSKEGAVVRHLVSMIADGKDVTEKRRKKLEKALAGDAEKADEDAEGEDLVDPFGESAEKYSFGEPRNDGDTVLLSFEPKPEYLDEAGMSRGTLCWHRESLDPLWFEMTAVTAPRPLRELEFRAEFARAGDILYVNRLLTKGVVKILVLTRRFESDLRISDIESE